MARHNGLNSVILCLLAKNYKCLFQDVIVFNDILRYVIFQKSISFALKWNSKLKNVT